MEAPPTASSPSISVVIPTYNQLEDVRRCLDSLSANNYPHWDVLLMDQSDDARVEAVAAEFKGRLPGLVYRRLREKGTCLARNQGMEMTTGEIVSFLDHDCAVPDDWLRQIAGVFARYPEAPLVFGAVEAATTDPSYVVPVVNVAKERVVRGRLSYLRIGGAGMNMHLRRGLADRIGPLDTCLGPGPGVFSAAEDEDYRWRCLAHGYAVCETPSIVVRHHGARDWESGAAARLMHRYFYSAGGCYMKWLRSGDLLSLVVIAAKAWGFLRLISIRNLLLRRGHVNAIWTITYARGLVASFQFGVDRRRLLYTLRPAGSFIGALTRGLAPSMK